MTQYAMEMKRIELERRHKEEIERMERELGLFNQFVATVPAEIAAKVERLHGFNPIPWVIFKAGTWEEAFDILQGVGPLKTVSGMESGCTSIAPVGEHGKRYEEGRVKYAPVESAVLLEQHTGNGFASADLSAYTASGFRIKINIPWHLIPAEMRDVVIFMEANSFGNRRWRKQYGNAGGAAWMVRFGGTEESVSTTRAFCGIEAARNSLIKK